MLLAGTALLFLALWWVLMRADGSPGDGPTGSRPPERRGPLVFHVSAGAPSAGDGSEAEPFRGIEDALARAGPGDTIAVGPGRYRRPLATVRDGRPGAPIRIVGTDAEIVGNGKGRLVRIDHDHVELEGFELSKARNLIWVVGATGVRIVGNVLHDAGGECVRLRYFSHDNEVAGNRIDDCGQEGFDLDERRKNGEGIYIGTAPEQLDRNPTNDPDASDRNWIHDNVISTPAECIDVKEGSAGNRIERNRCTGGRDPEGGGMSSRGRGTLFVDNVSSGHAGAGIRLGGDRQTDGVLSVVRNNELTGNAGFGLKVLRMPQGLICGNRVTGNGDGDTNAEVRPAAPCPGQ